MAIRRLSNAELMFLENTIALFVGIIRDAKALSFCTDDPEQLEIILQVLIKAQGGRKSVILWMEGRKNETG